MKFIIHPKLAKYLKEKNFWNESDMIEDKHLNLSAVILKKNDSIEFTNGTFTAPEDGTYSISSNGIQKIENPNTEKSERKLIDEDNQTF